MRKDHVVILTPLGKLALVSHDEKLISLSFVNAESSVSAKSKHSVSMISFIEKLQRYFYQTEPITNLPIQLHGTDFQKKVWQRLRQIPLGEKVTYGELAKSLKTSARAIGGACRHNPIPIIVPCHRIVAAKHIGGYCGHTNGKILDRKVWLLAHESKTC